MISKIGPRIIYSILFLGLIFQFTALSGQEEKLKPGETKVIIDSGVGKFDPKLKNNYNKNILKNHRAVGSVKEIDQKCSVCQTTLKVLLVRSPLTSIDTDFCPHFIGESSTIFSIWSCSVCGYCNLNNLFPLELSDEEIQFVKKYNTKIMHQEVEKYFGKLFKGLDTTPVPQKVIPTFAKVKCFASFIEHKNDLNEKWKAFYYARAIYSLRNEIYQTPSPTSINTHLIKILEISESELDIKEDDKNKPHFPAIYLQHQLTQLKNPDLNDDYLKATYLLLIAQNYDRLGHITLALESLDKAAKIYQKNPQYLDAYKFSLQIKEMIEYEKSLCLKAATSIDAALEAKVDYGKDVTGAIYLAGEFYRRAGEYKKSFLFLNAAKRVLPEESPNKVWANDILKDKNFQDESFLLASPPEYLKELVLKFNNP